MTVIAARILPSGTPSRRPGTFCESSTGQLRTVQFGWSALVPVPGDYDGDGRTDIAVRDPKSSTWYIV